MSTTRLLQGEITDSLIVEKKGAAGWITFNDPGRHNAMSYDMWVAVPKAIKLFEADDEILVKRLLERGKTSGRIDDQDEEKIRNRYQEYNEKTAPLMDYYAKQGKFHAVNGIGSIAEITQRVSNVIDNL